MIRGIMKGRPQGNFNPRIVNRKATHDFFITHKIECGIVLLGSEVKSIRLGRVQLSESFARIDRGDLVLHGCHIDPYEKAFIGHDPLRERKLLVHRRELKKLVDETSVRGTTLVPLAIYFKDGRASSNSASARASSSTTNGRRSRRRNRTASCAGS